MPNIHITVAAVIENQNKFLLVTDITSNGHKLNQPAGHVEANEDIITAVIREVYEESSMNFIPKKLIGIYLYNPNPENTYLRFCFKGIVTNIHETPRPIANDDGVIAAGWYDLETIKSRRKELRSTLVMKCIDDYLSGIEFPLEVLANHRDNLTVYLD